MKNIGDLSEILKEVLGTSSSSDAPIESTTPVVAPIKKSPGDYQRANFRGGIVITQGD